MSQFDSEPPDKKCHSDLLQLLPRERSTIFQCLQDKERSLHLQGTKFIIEMDQNLRSS